MIEKIFALKIESEANKSEHWTKKSKRHTHQKNMINLFLKPLIASVTLPCHVILTRIAPRKLDEHDNLRSSLKWVVDAIASLLLPNLQAGRADDSSLIKWFYKQEKGRSRQYALKIVILDELDFSALGLDFP